MKEFLHENELIVYLITCVMAIAFRIATVVGLSALCLSCMPYATIATKIFFVVVMAFAADEIDSFILQAVVKHGLQKINGMWKEVWDELNETARVINK